MVFTLPSSRKSKYKNKTEYTLDLERPRWIERSQAEAMGPVWVGVSMQALGCAIQDRRGSEHRQHPNKRSRWFNPASPNLQVKNADEES